MTITIATTVAVTLLVAVGSPRLRWLNLCRPQAKPQATSSPQSRGLRWLGIRLGRFQESGSPKVMVGPPEKARVPELTWLDASDHAFEELSGKGL